MNTLEENKSGKAIAVFCFLVVFVGLGFISAPRSLYVVPVTEALGIDRSVYSVMDSLRYVSTAVVNLFFGILVARIGPRILIGLGFLALTLSMLVFSLANGLLLLYLAGILMGIGFAFTSTSMVGYVIRRAYPKNSGSMTGAVLAANGLGGAVCTPLVSSMIHGALGYRGASLVLAATVGAVGLISVLFLRGPAVGRGVAPVKSERAASADGTGGGLRLLLLSAIIFFSGFCLQGICGVAAAHMSDVGIDEGIVASALSLQLLFLTLSKFLTGFLSDRFGLRVSVLVSMLGAVSVSVILCCLVGGTLGGVLAFVYSILVAIALPLETVMLPLYARAFFGEGQFASRLGVLVSVSTAGYALGAPFLNLIYDLSGSYFIGFLVTGILMLFSLLTVQCIIPRKKK